jgi:TrbC/VIRB2 pilin
LHKSIASRLTRLRTVTVTRQQVKEKAALAARTAAPLALALAMSSIAHAQGTVDFSGATTVMNSFKTFAEYAGAVICLGSLIFAGIRLMSGRFQDAIPGLFGALFGAGVLGWGAGWISSLTGQSVSQ